MGPPTRRSRQGGGPHVRVVASVGVFLLVLGVAVSATSSVTFESVSVRLVSSQYYPSGAYTCFTYEVTGPSRPACAYWILGSCDKFRDALWWTSGYEWASAPLYGVRLTPSKKKETFYLNADGQWGVGKTEVGVYIDRGGSGRFLQGWIGGPACAAASLSLAVTAGSSVAFPAVSGPGVFPALNGTTLRVQSTSAGWVLTTSESYLVPGGGSEAVAGRIFEVTIDPHANPSGVTDISVDYLLRITEADFGSLPQGTYQITITYTVTTG